MDENDFPESYDALISAIREKLGLASVGQVIILLNKKARTQRKGVKYQPNRRYKELKEYVNGDLETLLDLLRED